MRYRTYKNADLTGSEIVSFVTALASAPSGADGTVAVSIQLERLSETGVAAEGSPFLGEELSAGGFGCGNDLVEARITAQIIPARIEAEIAV
jgi:hypothetical protein